MDDWHGYNADAAILGGGLTALLLGSGLAHAGLRVMVVQSGDGEVEHVTGAGTLLCAHRYQRIEAAWGTETAQLYAAALHSQLHMLSSASLPYIRSTAALIYARTADELPVLASQQELLMRLHLPVSEAPDAQGCPFPAERSLLLEGQAMADIPRWTGGLRREICRRGGRILRSQVISIEGQQLHTAQGRITAPVIVHAGGKPPGLRSIRMLSMLETRLIVRCTMTGQPAPDCILLPVQEDEATLLPAPEGMCILWDAHRLGSGTQHARLSHLNELLQTRLPDWLPGEQRCVQQEIPLDGLPMIGILPGTRLLFATGYDGILGAMHAAQLLMRRILGHAAPEDRIYSPDRKLPGSIRRAAVLRSTGIRAASALRRAPACPHCRCRMRYSSLSRWECPLCGSVFSVLGSPIYGPTLRHAQVSPRQRPDI